VTVYHQKTRPRACGLGRSGSSRGQRPLTENRMSEIKVSTLKIECPGRQPGLGWNCRQKSQW
jgi:hypothetical protein